MKTKIILIFLFSLMIPNLALAAWWNPFSWSWFAPKVLQTPPISDYRPNPVVASTNIDTIQKPRSLEPVSPKATTQIIPKKDPPVVTSSISSKNTEPTSPKAMLIAKFLKDPTLENFKIFCNEAKNIEGNSTKQVLDSSRQNLITIKLTYYDDLRDCKDLLDPSSITSYLPPSYISLDDSLLISLAYDDQDWLREAKILYNNKIRDLIKTSKVKFIAFKKAGNIKAGEVADKESIKLPTDLFRYWEGKINTTQQVIGPDTIDPLNQYYPTLSESAAKNVEIGTYNPTIENAKENIKRIHQTVYDISNIFR